MRTLLKAVCPVAALLSLALVSARTVQAEDAPAAINPADFMKAMAEAGKPGAEHARLEPLVGNWDYTAKFWMDPNQPPVETQGTIERKWILGNRFLEEKIQGSSFDGQSKFEGIGLVGYDNGLKKYTSNFACSMGTGVCKGVGTANEKGDTFTFKTESYCPVFQKTMHGREVVRIESNDKIVFESYMTMGDQEVKMMEITTPRK